MEKVLKIYRVREDYGEGGQLVIGPFNEIIKFAIEHFKDQEEEFTEDGFNVESLRTDERHLYDFMEHIGCGIETVMSITERQFNTHAT
jgi:hypothetical protein